MTRRRRCSRLALLAAVLGVAASAPLGTAPAQAALGPEASAAVVAAPPGQGTSAPTFKIAIEHDGVYRVAFERLAEAAGRAIAPLESEGLALTNRGTPVPLWVADGGDGRLGPGDHVEFVGEHLAGTRSFYNEYSRHNVYVLETGGETGARMTLRASGTLVGTPRAGLLTGHRRVEHDTLMVRFAGLPAGAEPELWYWAKLSHLDREPFEHRLELPDLDTESNRFAGLKIELRGWSHAVPRPPVAEHRVEVALNGVRVGSGEWSGQDAYTVDLPALPLGLLRAGDNTLTLRIPRRDLPGSDRSQAADAAAGSIIDVVLLNWIEITYPRRGLLAQQQERLRVDGHEDGTVLALRTESGQPEAARGEGRVIVYGEDGSRIEAEAQSGGARGVFVFRAPAAELGVDVVRGDGLMSPVDVVLDDPSQLRDTARQADYLMITHRTLRTSIEPLAAFHRAGGLSVEVVDVDDVYDEFSYGIVSPAAIRDFIAFAYHDWRAPAPRFVLLVGDASWDIHNAQPDDANYADWTYRPGETTRFVKNGSTTYFGVDLTGHRNLIPAAQHDSPQGQAASDNWFVSVDGDDFHPDLAIGRFPVTEPEEVRDIVAKTIAYASAPEGDWNRRILWIANEDAGIHTITDQVAAAAEQRGFVSRKVYPGAAEADNAGHQALLRDAFDEGQLLVHFFGHGGRYIWRTGPPDIDKNHDLFTLEDLERLQPTTRLPIVLSMTCYSAPFDHPTADSIGEKFLRLPSRGAVAVFAASWRNTPNRRFSETVVGEMTRPGTIGEALLRAKRATPNRVLVETYNLLGDPALQIALPPLDTLAAATNDAADDTSTAATDGAAAGGVGTAEREARSVTRTTVAGGASGEGGGAGAGDPSGPEGVLPNEPEDAGRPGVHANTLSWSTASEVDNFGFDVYRGISEEGPFARITPEPIPGAGTTDTMSEYEFVDDTIDPCQPYFYYVESISLAGVRERFTPVLGVEAKLAGDPRCGGR